MTSTEADLLHLVDRAEAGTLLAAEAQQLRDGIRRYATAERVVLAAFNSAKAVVTATASAFQQLGLLAEHPAAEPQQLPDPDWRGECCGHERSRHWSGIGRCISTRCTCTGFVTA